MQARLLERFYNTIYRNNDIIELRFLPQDKNRNVIREFIKHDTSGFVDRISNEILKYNSNYNCYFGIHPRKANSTNLVSTIRCCFVDIDSKDFLPDPKAKYQIDYETHIDKLLELLKKFNLYPSMIVNSGHGKHLYWKFKIALKVKENTLIHKSSGEIKVKQENNTWTELQKSLIHFCKSDTAIKDLPRIFRIPSSMNIKDTNKPVQCVIEELNDYEYTVPDFNVIIEDYKSHLKKEKQKSKANKEYQKNYDNNDNFKKAVIDTLKSYFNQSGCTTYDDYLHLFLSLKHAGFRYDEIDEIFTRTPNYNYEYNKKQFESMKPDGSVTFATAYYYAKKANETYLKNKLKEYNRKSSIEINCNQPKEDNPKRAEQLEATRKNVITEFHKYFELININPENTYRQVKNTYLVYNHRTKIMPIYKDSKHHPYFKDLMEARFLPKFYVKSFTKTGQEKHKDYKFPDFWASFSSFILENDDLLQIKDASLSNAPVVLNDELTYKTCIDKGLIISNDNENLIYEELSEKEYPEVESIFKKLFGDNNLLIQADIISTIINEDNGSKHFTTFTASPRMGKSKTVEFIIRVCSNKFKSSLDLNEVDKMWESFFSTRTPFFDNVDVSKNFDSGKANTLAGIITSSSINMNVRYSRTGKLFNCDVYPKMTTTDENILNRKDLTAIRSRTIQIRQEYNSYAKMNLEDIYKNKDFIEKVRKHFFWKIKNYLSAKKEGKTRLPSKIDHRAKNFFKVLYYLSPSVCENYYRKLSEMEEYNEVTSEFLEMLRSKYFYNGSSIKEIRYSATEWVDELKDFTDIDKIRIDDKMNNQTLFRYNIDKYVVSEQIAEFQIKKGRTGRKRYISFTLVEEDKEQYNIDDEIELSEYKGNTIEIPSDDRIRMNKILDYRTKWEYAMLDDEKELANTVETLMYTLFRNGDKEEWENISKPQFMKIMSSGGT